MFWFPLFSAILILNKYAEAEERLDAEGEENGKCQYIVIDNESSLTCSDIKSAKEFKTKFSRALETYPNNDFPEDIIVNVEVCDLDYFPSNITNLTNKTVELFITMNKIKFFQGFQGNKYLSNLRLFGNKIEKLQKDLFKNLPELQRIHFEETVVKVPAKIILENVPKLELLSIKECNLIEVEFKGELFTQLTHLKLDGNKIKNLSPKFLNNIKFIEHICLENNFLGEGMFSKPNATFEKLPMLEYLNLKANKIKILPIGIFSKLISLKELNIANNQLKNLNNKSFEGLLRLNTLILHKNKIASLSPGMFLKNPSLKYLDLSNNELGELPKQGLLKLTKLQADNNKIKTIEGCKNLKRIKKLYLNENLLQNLNVNVFAPLTNLQILELNSNNIKKIKVGAFNNLSNLKQLLLRANGIQELKVGVFKGLNKLEILSLGYNKLKILNPGVLKNLPALNYLELNNNLLWTIGRNAFLNLPRLGGLSLSNNRIKKLTRDSFKSIPALQSLDLHNNSLTIIKKEYFSKLTNLTSIDLEYNKIRYIEPGSFPKSAVIINLDNNNLQRLNFSMFNGLEGLEMLHLRNNKIKAFSMKVFDQLPPSLKKIDLEGNKMKKTLMKKIYKKLLNRKKLFAPKSFCNG